MSVSDYTDVIAGFPDRASAEVFAKFVATEGVPCHITALWKATRFERHDVRVQRDRIAGLRRVLRLKRIADGMSATAVRILKPDPGARAPRQAVYKNEAAARQTWT